MVKCGNKFAHEYIPENDLEENATKYNPVPTNIGRSKDVDYSYLAATSVKQLLKKNMKVTVNLEYNTSRKLDVIIILLNSSKLSLFGCRRFEIISFVVVIVVIFG